ncbi:MAG: M1 family metallopeptidase [Chitinophagaceae bacterium]|nr:M1 family metallopeptidase [Chitinophagaceae bacterium]
MRKLITCGLIGLTSLTGLQKTSAQDIQNNPKSNHGNKFEQLGTILPTPNEYRSASGAPGPKYWQQRADYKIVCSLDEANLKLTGKETITYFNNSPDVLSYLWLQLDENEHDPTVGSVVFDQSTMRRNVSAGEIARIDRRNMLEGFGVKIAYVKQAVTNKPLSYTINQTMMRIDLPVPLKPGQQFAMDIGWNYKIPDRMSLGGRGGYEFFPEDGNHLFTMTQWFPRMCVYSDFQGWQHKQFTGRGEFALTFGNYDVTITVPGDHLVAATGECQNYAEVLTPAQMSRWQKAQAAKEPVEIGLLADAIAAEKGKSTKTKTWRYKASMVRDFAWTSSRKYIWDAMPALVEGKKVMCMSLYPKEAYNLYRKYSTKAVAHTIKTYSKFSIPYPYPVAQSIEASNGMEYPMICFNYGRTEKDGTYTEAVKYGMLGVVIHEVGHNFFPMIVNSDERQWSWMDEGLNTFVQYLTEELWDNKYPSRRGPAWGIVDYMKLPKDQLEPIMTNSENIVQFGPNAYSKPATGLNILRETIMGRELFDFAFREYARRWAFKHPEPADLFRTMEDASAVDLDWFWRGWFYGIDPVDIALDSVREFTLEEVAAREPQVQKRKIPIAKPQVNSFEDVSKIRNREDKTIKFATDEDTSLRDFYWYYARGLKKIDDSPAEIEMAGSVPMTGDELNEYRNKFFYEVHLTNKGGLVMPLILEFTYEDGTKDVEKVPAEIWRLNENNVTKVFVKNKKVVKIVQDPMRETADINENNNVWPGGKSEPSRFQMFKGGGRNRNAGSGGVPNPMQREMK